MLFFFKKKLTTLWFYMMSLAIQQTNNYFKLLSLACCRLVFHLFLFGFFQDAYSEIAYLFAEFFRDLDIVPSDIIAGLVLLRQRQRAKRSAVLDEVSVRNSHFNCEKYTK